jgi:hypothetical protein
VSERLLTAREVGELVGSVNRDDSAALTGSGGAMSTLRLWSKRVCGWRPRLVDKGKWVIRRERDCDAVGCGACARISVGVHKSPAGSHASTTAAGRYPDHAERADDEVYDDRPRMGVVGYP